MDQPDDTEEVSGLGLDSQVIDSNLAAALLEGSQRPVRLGPFQLVRRIGSGGMSVVFQALDTRDGHDLALKILHVRGPLAVQRLKREFRALADIHHANLVRLHELIVDGDQAFFTMELVHGQSIVEFLRRDGRPERRQLKRVLGQLVDAVSTLHAGGMLHRDLKPSNILVEPDGRVVVLDFGLARTLADQAEGVGSGTPVYMAPERMRGDLYGEPSDWYSVGVVLCEALTGQLPSSATLSELVDAGPRALDDLDLAELCRALLDREPQNRPRAPQLRAAFELPALPEAASLMPVAPPSTVFIGREAELAKLHDAYVRAASGHSTIAYVHGDPGIGKTALVKTFLQALEERHDVLVLAGRCYEHELIPYNAVDGVVDCLVKALDRLPAHPEREPLAIDMLALEHIFPALAGSDVAPRGEALNPNPTLLRQRAFAAFRALIHELSVYAPVVIHLDDLQWADTDSAQLLSHLLQEPNRTRMLVIASYRAQDAERNVCVRALREVRPALDWELPLGPLLVESSLELARALSHTHVEDAELQELVRESAGSPLFLRSLIQHHASRSQREPTTLQQLLGSALERLPASSRELLELVALAARPVDRQLLLRAALAPDNGPEPLFALQRSGLVRAVATARSVALDTYHDRVREIISASIEPLARQRYHAQLAAAEALASAPDPEFLAYQYERAAQLDAAAKFAELAGDRASAGLAFARAVELYALALRCMPGQRPLGLLEKLANATAYAGRCAQAAPLYLEIADAPQADVAHARRMRLRATEMLLRRGLVAESVRTVRPVLQALGVRYPSFAPEAMLSIAVSALQLWLRREGPPVQQASELEKLRRELCFVLGYRLALVDPLPGSALLLRSLVMVLRSGTSAELARTLVCYAWILATLGWGSNEAHDRLLAQADVHVRGLDDPDVEAWTLYGRGMTLYTRGHFDAALALLQKGHALVATQCTEGWLLAELELLICVQYVAKGEVANLATASEPVLQHLRDTGNELQSAVLGALRSQILVAKDQPEAALSSLDEILSTWTHYAPAIISVWSKVNTLMYCGQAAEAWRAMQKHWRAFGRAGYKRVNPWSVALPLLESTVALACAQAGLGPKYVKHVEQGIAWLKGQRADWARPSALLLRAGLAHLMGRRAEAAQRYADAAAGYEELGMFGYSNIARMRQAELSDGAGAAHVRQQAEQWFSAQGILRPYRWMKMYAPIGYADAGST